MFNSFRKNRKAPFDFGLTIPSEKRRVQPDVEHQGMAVQPHDDATRRRMIRDNPELKATLSPPAAADDSA